MYVTAIVKHLHRQPLLRALLPLMLGIHVAHCCPGLVLPLWLLFLPLVSMAFCLWKRLRYAESSIFPVSLLLFFVMLGILLSSDASQRNPFASSQEVLTYEVEITDTFAKEKPHSLAYYAEEIRSAQPIQLYVQQSQEAERLRPGDRLLIRCKPDNRYNMPSCYLRTEQWKYMGHSEPTTLMARMRQLRNDIIQQYRQLGFSGDQLGLLSAMTLGQKRLLSKEIKTTYSAVGASHVLALSGLHIGILYLLLLLMLRPVEERFPFMKPVNTVVILVVIWLYAILTGCAASVVRSTTMFSLLTLARHRYGSALSGHNLTLAAFVMLLVNPLWLYDVGFQLSFSALAAILVISPLLSAIYMPQNRVLRYLFSLAYVALAAQLGTLPLVLYYFHQFAPHFLLSNFVVIPLASVIIYGTVVMMIISPLSQCQQMVATALQSVINFQNDTLSAIAGLPSAQMRISTFTVLDVIIMYLVFVLLAMVLEHVATALENNRKENITVR